MAVDPEALRRRADAVRSRIALSSIIGRTVTLVKRGHEHVGLCPFHADTKIGSFSVNDAKGIYKCFACEAHGDHFSFLEARAGLSFMQALKDLEAGAGIDFTDPKANAEYERQREKRERAAAADAERRRRNAVGLWQHAAPMKGTPAQNYLEGRGIDFAALGRLPGAIRYRHDCWNSELRRAIPAMVSQMTLLDGTHVATHRTYLEYQRGRWVKAPLDMPKMTLGNFAGAHIALNKGDAGRMPLRDVPQGTVPHISEGIEDGLTIAMADPTLRVIAAATLGNIGGLELPEAVSEVILIGQHDKPGSAADDALERQIARHQDAGRQVLCMWPEPGFKDFNDQLRGVRMDGA